MEDHDPALSSRLKYAIDWSEAAERYSDITGSSPLHQEIDDSRVTPHRNGGLYTFWEAMDELQRRAIGITSWEPDSF